jgi:predicted transcriptional regulator
MASISELRLQANLTVNKLATLAHIDRATVLRAQEGQPVQDIKAKAIVDVLNERLGLSLDFRRDVDGLVILGQDRIR